MIKDWVVVQGAARRLGAEDDAITEHTRRDASQDASLEHRPRSRRLLGG
jgi:hypothetical protein